jgi:hypothetical protein
MTALNLLQKRSMKFIWTLYLGGCHRRFRRLKINFAVSLPGLVKPGVGYGKGTTEINI